MQQMGMLDAKADTRTPVVFKHASYSPLAAALTSQLPIFDLIPDEFERTQF